MEDSPYKSVKALFDQAIELPPDQRASFLEDAGGDDHELRQQVHRLLERHDEAERESSSETDPGMADELRDGATIGPFHLERRLGEGAQGKVFLAHQLSPVERMVALKFLRTGMSDSGFLARFELERKALAVLEHSGIAQIFDAGTTDSGVPWISMEWVDGKPITSYCREEKLPLSDRLELICQACDAVQHAHRRGVLHRDIKPGNLLVSNVDGKPIVKVIDFGIAKLQDEDLLNGASLTRTGMFFGTPAYISPEQARLTPGGVDTRSDVYSLGAILFELVTGTTPVENRRIPNMPLDELLRTICEEEAPTMAGRIRTLPSDGQGGDSDEHRQEALRNCRQGLNWIAARALEKDPDNRYDSPLALSEDLRRFQQDLPLEAGPHSIRYRFTKFLKRRRKEAIAAVLLLAVAITGGAVATRYWRDYQSERFAKERSHGLVEWRNLESQMRIRNETSFLIEQLTPGTTDLSLIRNWESKVDGGEWGDSNGNATYNRIILGKAYGALGRVGDSEEQFLLAIDQIHSGLNKPDRYAKVELEIRSWLAFLYLEQGRYEEARALAEENMSNWTWWRYWKHRMESVVQWADWLEQESADPLALAEKSQLWFIPQLIRFEGDYDQWFASPGETKMMALEKTARYRMSLFPGDHESLAARLEIKADLARAVGYQHRGEEGVEIMHQVLEHHRNASGVNSEKAITTELDLAWILNAERRLEEAREVLEKTVERAGKHLGPEHKLTRASLYDLALIYSLSNRSSEAEACRQRLFEIWVEGASASGQ